ncbi:MAG: VWA domain-containing protein [Pyrinomonadaceae bacterium]
MISRSHRALALLATLFVFASASAQEKTAATPPAVAPTASDLVMLTATIQDRKGRHLRGLTQKQFTVFEGKQPLEIKYFSNRDEPLSLGIVLDRSGSMSERIGSSLSKAALKDGLLRFMLMSNEANVYFFGGFNVNAQLFADWTYDSNVFAAALNKVEQMPTKRLTALNDAFAAALEKVSQGPNSKRVLLFFSDGRQDNASLTKHKDLRRMIQQTDVLIYAVVFVDRSALDVDGQVKLDELTSDSGGKAYFVVNEKELEQALTLIAAELRSQYRFGFIPVNSKRAGKWIEVKLKIDHQITSKTVCTCVAAAVIFHPRTGPDKVNANFPAGAAQARSVRRPLPVSKGHCSRILCMLRQLRHDVAICRA